MVESYIEYILSQCSEGVIPIICSLYETKEKLLEDARKGGNGNNYILDQGLLIRAAVDFISDNGYIVSSQLDSDARKLHARCIRNFREIKEDNLPHIEADWERIFNTLVDVNWLFSSKYIHIQRKQDGLINLLSSPSIIRIGIRDGLKDVLYNRALYYKDRSEQYEKAQLIRYQFLPGTHQDAQVRDLFSQGYTYSNFKELQMQAHKCSIQFLALFYALTATAAKAEQIRRMR